MQAQSAQVVQAVAMTAINWYPIVISAAIAILAAFGAAFMTHW